MKGSAKRTISASEIGSYLYCARSWAYQRQGKASGNVAELQRGDEAHQAHGRQARAASGISRLALLLLLAAILSLLLILLR